MDSLGIAETVVIRHRCHCTPVAQPPHDTVIEHVFTVDGEDFPWLISDRGPIVTRLADDFYAVDVEILLLNKNRNDKGRHEILSFGYETYDGQMVPFRPVIGGVVFPFSCTDDEITLRFTNKILPTLRLKFLARDVDAKGIEIDDQRPQWIDRAMYRGGGDLVKDGMDECNWCQQLTPNLIDHIETEHPERCRGSEVTVSG